MKTKDIIAIAKEAGFGCGCEGDDCAYHIAVRGNEVLLPKAAGVEAIEKFEEMAPDLAAGGSGGIHYWSVKATI